RKDDHAAGFGAVRGEAHVLIRDQQTRSHRQQAHRRRARSSHVALLSCRRSATRRLGLPKTGAVRTRYIATARARHEISVPWRSLDRTCAGTGAVFLYGDVEVTLGTLSLGTFVAYMRV